MIDIKDIPLLHNKECWLSLSVKIKNSLLNTRTRSKTEGWMAMNAEKYIDKDKYLSKHCERIVALSFIKNKTIIKIIPVLLIPPNISFNILKSSINPIAEKELVLWRSGVRQFLPIFESLTDIPSPILSENRFDIKKKSSFYIYHIVRPSEVDGYLFRYESIDNNMLKFYRPFLKESFWEKNSWTYFEEEQSQEVG